MMYNIKKFFCIFWNYNKNLNKNLNYNYNKIILF